MQRGIVIKRGHQRVLYHGKRYDENEQRYARGDFVVATTTEINLGGFDVINGKVSLEDIKQGMVVLRNAEAADAAGSSVVMCMRSMLIIWRLADYGIMETGIKHMSKEAFRR